MLGPHAGLTPVVGAPGWRKSITSMLVLERSAVPSASFPCAKQVTGGVWATPDPPWKAHQQDGWYSRFDFLSFWLSEEYRLHKPAPHSLVIHTCHLQASSVPSASPWSKPESMQMSLREVMRGNIWHGGLPAYVVLEFPTGKPNSAKLKLKTSLLSDSTGRWHCRVQEL